VNRGWVSITPLLKALAVPKDTPNSCLPEKPLKNSGLQTQLTFP
jgi:hypothetical protein